MNRTTSDHLTHARAVRLQAAAGHGMLARLTAVLNPHPVTAFTFEESTGGRINVTVRLAVSEPKYAVWHLQRVVSRLQRIVGVTNVEVVDERMLTSVDSDGGVLLRS
jgi:hypothetical protein